MNWGVDNDVGAPRVPDSVPIFRIRGASAAVFNLNGETTDFRDNYRRLMEVVFGIIQQT